MTKRNITSVQITRAEGPSALCGIECTFATFAEANSHMSTYWKDIHRGGMDKVDFVVTYERTEVEADNDEHTYRGTYFLNHSADSHTSIQAHMKWHLEFHAGIGRPDHFSDENWDTHLINIQSSKQECLDFLNEYALYDGTY